ncbi:TITAN protein [Spatholobus suberectus]|nr:TITAN protein [Spatholobus suberectus]
MGDQCESESKRMGTKKQKKKKSEFEFCKVCNINHDQGLRHKYFPNHKKSLSTFLSRFRKKLSNVRSFLNAPIPLNPQLASRNRIWCVFCDQDINEHSSSFASANAIRHLASAEHVKNLKHFFWKYGVATDQLDAFMVSDDDVLRTLRVANVATSSEACSGANPSALQAFAVERRSHSLPHDGRQWSSDGYSRSKQVHDNGRMVSGESNHQGLQMITQISSVPTEIAGGNVHSGAPPVWLEATEVVQMHSESVLGDPVSHSNKLGKSKKLNPERVGAAWAEKRKIEMEKEKRGETVRNECDANWLPNFGRVWQSGSRKESRKEFEREKQKLNVENQSEMPIKIQPYVSKRMRMDNGGDYASG